MRNITTGIFCFMLLTSSSCENEIDVEPGNDPNFTIRANIDKDYKGFNRRVEVFGISVYAVPKVDDDQLLHAANVMAQYLDNDEDGEADNPEVLQAIHDNQAVLVMWQSQLDLIKVRLPNGVISQDLGNDETIPGWHQDRSLRFDASLEEVFHLITHVGYASVYPEIFGEIAGTELANAMDLARGGAFDEIPDAYPAEAWYSYTDKTCDYGCQVTEYLYWAMTTILGAQKERADEIKHEWRLSTPEEVMTQDPAVYALLTNPEYKLPTMLPDGKYRQANKD